MLCLFLFFHHPFPWDLLYGTHACSLLFPHYLSLGMPTLSHELFCTSTSVCHAYRFTTPHTPQEKCTHTLHTWCDMCMAQAAAWDCWEKERILVGRRNGTRTGQGETGLTACYLPTTGPACLPSPDGGVAWALGRDLAKAAGLAGLPHLTPPPPPPPSPPALPRLSLSYHIMSFLVDRILTSLCHFCFCHFCAAHTKTSTAAMHAFLCPGGLGHCFPHHSLAT